MKKNSLIWIFALFLISIISIPIAYAQAATASWFYVLINAAIVFVVLFALQTFLIPGKADKEKTAVYVVLIILSLLIGLLFGRTGFIWQGQLRIFFNLYVLVNAIVIATVIYFILGLFKFNEKVGTTKEGLGGYGILIFLVSLIFAVKLGNQWIWQLSAAQQFYNYLFGNEGILNPDPPAYRLWIFITSLVMFAFFLQNFLVKNVAGGAKLNYALAFIIASNMASAGYGFASIIQLGEIIFLLVLWNGIKESVWAGKEGGRAFLIALFLVGWASAAVTMTSPEYRGVLGYGFCQTGIIDCVDAQKAAAAQAGGLLDRLWKNIWIIGLGIVLILIFAGTAIKEFLEAIGLKKDTGIGGVAAVSLIIILIIIGLIVGFKQIGIIGGSLLALVLALFGIVFGIRRLGAGEKRKLYKGVRNAYLKNLFGSITKAVLTKLPGFRTSFFRLRNIAGREPEIVYRNRLLFMRLLDQELRFDIFYTKFLYMTQFENLLKDRTEKVKGFELQHELKKQIVLLRSQRGKVNFGTDINPDFVGEDIDQSTSLPGYYNFKGWNYVNKIIIYYMNNHLYDFFSQRLSEIEDLRRLRQQLQQQLRQLPQNDPRIANIQSEIERIDREIPKKYQEYGQDSNRKLANDIGVIKSAIDASRGQYDLRTGIYPHHYIIKAYTLWLWDMFNSAGRGYHPYRFAKKGVRYIDANGNEANISDDTTEVNVYGEFSDDRRKLDTPGQYEQYKADVMAGRIRIRKLKNPKRDSVPFPPGENMGKIGEYYVRDWGGFIKDFRTGLYHPFSRNVAEYEDKYTGAWAQGRWKDDDIPWLPRGGSDASPAFDLRVLANPGIYKWWGREKYNDPETAVEKENKEPHISQFGIKQFILRLIDFTSAQVDEDKKFLQYYPADTGELPSYEEQKEGKKYSVGRFEERGGQP